MVNGWKLNCFINKAAGMQPPSQKDFKVAVTEGLLLTSDKQANDTESADDNEDPDFPANLPSLAKEHVVTKANKRLRCHNRCGSSKSGSNKTVFQCAKCNVHLHPDKCFKEYHDKHFK